jgi:hypothetical protein
MRHSDEGTPCGAVMRAGVTTRPMPGPPALIGLRAGMRHARRAATEMCAGQTAGVARTHAPQSPLGSHSNPRALRPPGPASPAPCVPRALPPPGSTCPGPCCPNGPQPHAPHPTQTPLPGVLPTPGCCPTHRSQGTRRRPWQGGSPTPPLAGRCVRPPRVAAGGPAVRQHRRRPRAT